MIGQLCRMALIDNRGNNVGCKGRIIVETVKYRKDSSQPFQMVEAYVCDRNGHAHGKVSR